MGGLRVRKRVSAITESIPLFFFFFNGGIGDSRNLPNPSAILFAVYIRGRAEKHSLGILYTTDLQVFPEGYWKYLGVQLTCFKGLALLSGFSPGCGALETNTHCPSAIYFISFCPSLAVCPLGQVPRLCGAVYKEGQCQLHLLRWL